jgi:hypothetical protein
MSNKFIGVSIKGMKDLETRLGRLKPPSKAYQAGVLAVAKEFAKEAKKYPPQNRPSRKSVYGKTFQSDAQRKYFFWAKKKGIIKVPYKRTGTLRRGWQVEKFGSDDAIVYNEVEYGEYVMQRQTQSKYMAAVPWKTQEEIMDRLARDKAGRIMANEVDKALAK